MIKPLVKIENLYVWFKVFDGISKVLEDVNFKVYPNEKVGLIGEASCGKTTTMKAVMRLLSMPPAIIPKGKIFVDDKAILKMNYSDFREYRKKAISMIFQDPSSAINPVFTIGSQFKDIILSLQKVNSDNNKKILKEEIEERSVKMLKKVSLPDPKRMLQSYSIQLSGGMRQRVCIAMSLLGKKKLIIADEPGTSLDVTIQDQILQLLGELAKKDNTAIILISHALGAVRKITERTYVMYAGSMVEVAKTNDLFELPLHPYTQGLFDAVPKLTGTGVGKGIAGSIPTYINPPTGCRFSPRCKHAMPICKEKIPPFFKIDEDHKVKCFLFKNKEVGD